MSWPVISRLSPKQHWLAATLGLIVILAVVHALLTPAFGAPLGYRSLTLSDNNAGASSNYQLAFSLSTPGTLGSVVVQFCSNDPFPEDSCDPPAGFNLSGANLVDQTGATGFSIGSNSTSNFLVLTRPPQAVGTTPVSYTLSGVVNPAAPGSYYVRVQTFASNDGSGNSSDYGGIAFAILANLSISAEVPPYLVFCTGVSIPQLNCASASGDYINFGEFSAQHASQGSSQMLGATNAQNGYSISLTGNTLTSGNNTIAALGSSDVSRPGTAQFGLNLRANASPRGGLNPAGPGSGAPLSAYNRPDFYRFVPNEVLASINQPDDARLYTASYIANISQAQAAGIYVSTITYVCLANF